MTTAGRPTWSTAVGSERGQYKMYTPTMQHSAKDERGHLHLKTRKPGQNTQEELKKKDLKEKLEAEEKAYFDKQKRPEELLKLNAPSLEAPKALPTPVVYDADDSSSDDSSSDDDSDAETAELMRELERIKKGRELEQAKLEQEKLERDARENADAVLRSNPLLDGGAVGDDSTVKRKWYDETVFKNQARDAPDAAGKKQKKTYVNDTIRNEFHRAFMNKYIK